MLKGLVAALLALFVLLIPNSTMYASNNTQSTSYTYTFSINGEIEISQDAYLPAALYLDLGLSDPQDLYIAGDRMYIADKGNKRILEVDLSDNSIRSIGEGVLNQPTGVSVDNNGRIYVADYGNEEAYRFDKEGNLEFTFKKPATPNFGRNEGFKPVKITHADDGGVYIVSEGTIAGIIHLNGTGDFLGYFASNEVKVSFFEKLQDFFLTAEQKKSFLFRTPPSFGNIFRGPDGLIYTVNKGKDVNIKKHSINGLNMFANKRFNIKLQDPTDIFVTQDGRIYVLQGDGHIAELTNDGDLICIFGGNSNKTDRVGLFEVPTGIAVDSSNRVDVLDGQKGIIQLFEPTAIQSGIHKALVDYNNGRYAESRRIFEEVLIFNSSSFLAHLYMGKLHMQDAKYEKAMKHFRIANVRPEYSTAYWEVRNIWLQENLASILLFLICVSVLVSIIKFIDRRKRIFDPIRRFKERLLRNKFVFDIANIKYAMFHPIDNAYDIKVNTRGSVAAASFIYILIFILLVFKQVGSGFIFSVDINKYSIVYTLISYVVIIGLFIICNYLVGSIHDGNGTIRTLYIGLAYSFSPAIFIMPFVILVSNFATFNEAFFIWAADTFVLSWCAISIILTVMELHEYDFRPTIGNLLLTLFLMIVVILAASMLYLFVKQIWDFVSELIAEVLLRAKA